jgi:type I restriction enzyme, S subunit
LISGGEILVRDLVACEEAELTTGPFGTQLKAGEYVEDGIPMINVRNVGFGEVRATNLEHLSEVTAQRLARHRLEAGDIVFGRKGAVERHAFISEDQVGWVQGSDCLRLRLRSPRFVPRFVSYFLLTEHHKQWMKNHCSGGATMASLNQDILGRIELPSVPLPAQRKIAAILSAYDDLIENNNRRIELLEEIAQRIYREWFVDFRYPGHESVPLVDSEVGTIPHGWEATTAAAFSEITIGGDWGVDNPDGDGWVHVACLRGVDLPLLRGGDSSSVRARWVKDSSLIKRRVTPSDVIVEGSGECGRALAIDEELERFLGCPIIYSNFCKRLRCRTSAQARYVARQFNAMVENGDMAQFRTGTTIPNLNFRALVESRLLVRPPEEILSEFERLTIPMERMALNGTNRNLRAARDLLLPRLISGEIDVTDLNIAVAEAAA